MPHSLQLGMGDQLNVWVSPCSDELWCQNAHGAVIGWECFVQLGHGSSDAGGLVEKVHFKAGIRQIQRSLYASDTTANNQNRADFLIHFYPSDEWIQKLSISEHLY
jgi:hypothetical protein